LSEKNYLLFNVRHFVVPTICLEMLLLFNAIKYMWNVTASYTDTES